MRHIVQRGLNPSRYRFGYLALAISTIYLWIVVCTAILDAFGAREGPNQYMRWMPDNAGHIITAPTSFALGRGLVWLAGYLRREHGISIVGVAHSPYFGAAMILLAGIVQAVVLFLLLRGPRLRDDLDRSDEAGGGNGDDAQEQPAESGAAASTRPAFDADPASTERRRHSGRRRGAPLR